jgi:predicted cupin superfamily sugar epimerase
MPEIELMDETAKQIIDRFQLKPHPEGGYFREVYRSPLAIEHPGIPAGHAKTRRTGSLIYYLLEGDAFSAFHRVRWTDEAWHLYAGGPLELHVIDQAGVYESRRLSCDLLSGEPTTIVDAGVWQATRLADTASWAFSGCTVSPGFDFDDFEMPDATALIEQYPEHAKIIRALTRS